MVVDEKHNSMRYCEHNHIIIIDKPDRSEAKLLFLSSPRQTANVVASSRILYIPQSEGGVSVITRAVYRQNMYLYIYIYMEKSKHVEVILWVYFFPHRRSVVCIFFAYILHPFRLKNVTCFIAVRRHRCHGLLQNWISTAVYIYISVRRAWRRSGRERIIKIYRGGEARIMY